jgi:hypothetical protein
MTDGDVPDRHLRDLIAQKMASFRAGEASLRELVDYLNSVWNDIPPSEWRDVFRGHWWTLEQVYAVAVDRDELYALPSDAASDIRDALEGIESLLETNGLSNQDSI